MRIERIAIATALTVAVLTLVLAAGLLFVFRSDPGHRFLASAVERLASTPERRIAIGELHGALPADLKLDDVTVSNAQGPWVRLGRVRMAWRPLALLRGRLDIDTVDAWNIALERSPPPSNEPAKAPPSLPSLSWPVHVGRATIHNVELPAEVAGTRMGLKAEASLDAAARELSFEARVDRLDREGRLEATAHISPQDILTLRAQVREPRGGLVSKLIGLADRPPVSLDLDGQGGIGDWKGTLRAAAGDDLRLESDLDLDARGPWRLAANGHLVAAGLARQTAVAPLMARPFTFDIAAAWDDGTRRLQLDKLTLGGPGITASAKGAADLAADRLDADVTATIEDTTVIQPLLGSVRLRRASAQARLEGALATPRVAFDVTAEEPGFSDLSAGRLRAQGTVAIQENGMPVRVVLASEDARLPGTALQTLLGASPTLEADATVAKDEVRIAQAALAGTGGRLTVSGTAGFAGTLDISAQASMTSIAAVLPEVEGPTSVTATIKRPGPADPISASLKGEIAPFGSTTEAVRDLIGDRLAVSADLAWDPAGSVRLSDANVSGKAVSLAGDAALRDEFKTLDGSFVLSAPDLSPLSRSLGKPVRGGGKITIALSGPTSDPAVTAALTAPSLQVSGTALGNLRADVRATEVVSGAKGSARLESATPWGAARTTAGFAVAGGGRRLDVKNLLAFLGDHLRGQGNASIPLDGAPAVGTLSVEETRLAAWSQLGRPLAGSARARIDLKAVNGTQTVDASLDANGASGATRVGSLNLRASVRDATRKPVGEVVVTAGNVEQGALKLASVSVKANGALDSGTLSLDARGSEGGRPVAAQAGGRFDRTGKTLRAQLTSLSGNYDRLPIRTGRPFVVTYADGLSFQDLDLSVGSGRLQGRGVVDSRRVEAQVDAVNLPLGPFLAAAGTNGAGTLNASIRLTGPTKAPEGSVTLALANLKTDTLPQAVAARLQGELRGGALNAELTGNAGGALTVSGRGRLPVALSAWPFAASVADAAPLTADAEVKGSLGALGESLLSSDQRLVGNINLRLTVGGTWGQPDAQGELRLVDAEYENYGTGTVLRDLSVLAQSDGRMLYLRNASATDGGRGRITASGRVDLSSDRKFPVELQADISDATLVRRDEATATVKGRALLTGTVMEPRLQADLTVNNAEVQLVNSAAAPSEAQLNVVEINLPPGRRAAEAQRANAAAESDQQPWSMALAVNIAMPGQVFVRGRGLESEWQGNVTVRGSTAKPIVEGELRPVRGDFTLAGRRFVLQEGTITLDGSEKIDPRVDLSAVYSASDLEVTVHAQGRASDPKIDLSSNPAMPQSEMLARVLFGKSASKLSATEAVQLAQAVATLSGSGGPTSNALGWVRNNLGLDRLSIGTAENSNAPTVQAGKYVTDRVYLGVQQGTGSQQTQAQVDVEITPSISVETNIGPSTGSNVGLKWSRDY